MSQKERKSNLEYTPNSEVHGANMGPTWVLVAPDGPHVGPMNLAVRDIYILHDEYLLEECILSVKVLLCIDKSKLF